MAGGDRRRSNGRIVILVAMIGCVPAVARADGLAVARAGATDCPDSVELASRVRAFTPKAPEPISGSSTAESIRVDFVRRGSRLQAVIRTTGQKQGTRTLDDDGPTCGALAEATALALAILVDPDAAAAIAKVDPDAGREEPPRSVEKPATPEAPPPPPVTPPADQRADGPRRDDQTRWRFSVSAGGGFVNGATAPIAALLVGTIDVRPVDIFSIEASALFAPPREHPLDRGVVDVSLAGGGAAGCLWPIAHAGPARIDAGGCVGALVASIRGEGRGYDAARSASRGWGAIDVHVGVRGALIGPLGWAVRAGPLIPFHRESFGVTNAGTAYEMSPIGAASSILLTAKIR